MKLTCKEEHLISPACKEYILMGLTDKEEILWRWVWTAGEMHFMDPASEADSFPGNNESEIRSRFVLQK